jgi:hypothetical protein
MFWRKEERNLRLIPTSENGPIQKADGDAHISGVVTSSSERSLG